MMKAHGRMAAWLHSFLFSALYGCEWSPSRPDRLTPGTEHPVPTGWFSDTSAAPAWNRTTFLGCPVRVLVTTVTELSRL